MVSEKNPDKYRRTLLRDPWNSSLSGLVSDSVSKHFATLLSMFSSQTWSIPLSGNFGTVDNWASFPAVFKDRLSHFSIVTFWSVFHPLSWRRVTWFSSSFLSHILSLSFFLNKTAWPLCSEQLQADSVLSLAVRLRQLNCAVRFNFSIQDQI